MPDNDVVGSLWVKLGLDTQDLSTGVTGAALQFSILQHAASVAFGYIQQGYDATVGAAIRYGQSIKEVAIVTGMTTDETQKWRTAAIAVGTDFNALATTMRMFSQRIGDAGKAGEDLRSKLSALGVQVKDSAGNFRSTSDIMWELFQMMQKMPDTFERNNLALDLFGRGWSSVAEMITDADRAKTAFDRKATMTPEQIEAMDEYGDKVGQVADNFNKIGVNIGTKVMPSLGALTDWMANYGDPMWDKYQKWLQTKSPFGVVEGMDFAKWMATIGPGSQNLPLGPEDYDWSKLQKTAIAAGIYDPFAGLDEMQLTAVELFEVTIPKLEIELNKAKQGTDKIAIAAAQINYNKAVLDLKEVNAEIMKAEDGTKALKALAIGEVAKEGEYRGAMLTGYNKEYDYTDKEGNPVYKYVAQYGHAPVTGTEFKFEGPSLGARVPWAQAPITQAEWLLQVTTPGGAIDPGRWAAYKKFYEDWYQKSITINVISPQGTPAQNAAAVQKALRDIGDQLGSSG